MITFLMCAHPTLTVKRGHCEFPMSLPVTLSPVGELYAGRGSAPATAIIPDSL